MFAALERRIWKNDRETVAVAGHAAGLGLLLLFGRDFDASLGEKAAKTPVCPKCRKSLEWPVCDGNENDGAASWHPRITRQRGRFVQIKISTRHGQLSEASQQKIAAKAEKLLRIFDRLTAIEIVVDLEDEANPRVDLQVSAEHKHDFVAHHQSESLMASVDEAIHKAEQQLRKYKEKVQVRHRTNEPRRRETTTQPESE
jgi:putative sigma-54 modulation protein